MQSQNDTVADDMLHVITPVDDEKIRIWAAYWDPTSYTIVTPESNIKLPLTHLTLQYRNKKFALLLRYLKSNPSIKQSLRTTLDILISILLTRAQRRPLVWICHNVDKEDKIGLSIFSIIQRNTVALFLTSIFVLDPLLISRVRNSDFSRLLRRPVDHISFGPLKTFGAKKHYGDTTDPSVKQQIIEFVDAKREEAQKEGRSLRVGLAIGGAYKKAQHFKYIPEFVTSAQQGEVMVAFIVACDVQKLQQIYSADVVDFLYQNSNVLFFSEEVGFDESEMRDYFDFVFRVMDDQSYSVTTSISVCNRTPIVTLDVGFLPTLVREYNLGLVLTQIDKCSVRRVVKLKPLEDDIANHFFARRRADRGAEKLFKSFNKYLS